MRGLSVVVRGDATAAATIAAARQHVRQVDAAVPIIAPREMSDVVAESMGQPRFRAWLFSAFGVLALILTLVGTFGLMSYVVTQRQREFGIRIALGATPSEVRRGVVVHGLRVVAAGLALGAAVALAAARSMQALLFGVAATDTLTICGAVGLLALASVAACYAPARRATRVSPIEALRTD
jgi:ABC-type antimicrobial peptide transport system permease subunit